MATIFSEADLKIASAFAFIGEPHERCFYVPAYQRDIAWGEKNINRFFESVAVGMHRLSALSPDTAFPASNAVTFIGTMICFDDRDHTTIHPKVYSELPETVYNVIDGQQRLTFLIAASAALHDYIRVGVGRIDKGWLSGKCEARLAELGRMFESEKFEGDYRHYPRMIRCFTDQWASTLENRRYHSPLSHLCATYGEFFRQQRESVKAPKRFVHKASPPFEADAHLRGAHVHFAKAVRYIRASLDKICQGNNSHFPRIGELMKQGHVLSALFPPGKDATVGDDVDFQDPAQSALAMAAALASYILRRVHFVNLVTTDEDYAFDIFESLNTTGEPLTAYQTFKPEVVRREGLENFETSASKTHVDAVESHLGSGDFRKKATAELVVSFALSENGERVSNSLRDQRDYLRTQYKGVGSLEEQRLFTRHFMHASETAQLWNGAADASLFASALTNEVAREWEVARFCLDFLKSANHTIAKAVITRFHEAARIADHAEQADKILSLCSAIKAVAAFFALWRGSREGTDGIDARYRELMKSGLPEIGVSPFSRRARDGGDIPVQDVKRALCRLLEQSRLEIDSGDKWANCVAKIPIYRTAKSVARFLILAAAHDAEPSDTSPGKLIPARSGVRPIITARAWGSKEHETVEHIVPRAHRSRLQCDEDALHILGNLTLLPKGTNSALRDREWPERKAIFRALSAETEDKLEEAKADPKFPASACQGQDWLQSHYLPMTRAVSLCADFTSLAHIDERGQNLAQLAWQRLAVEWLGFKDES